MDVQTIYFKIKKFLKLFFLMVSQLSPKQFNLNQLINQSFYNLNNFFNVIKHTIQLSFIKNIHYHQQNISISMNKQNQDAHLIQQLHKLRALVQQQQTNSKLIPLRKQLENIQNKGAKTPNSSLISSTFTTNTSNMLSPRHHSNNPNNAQTNVVKEFEDIILEMNRMTGQWNNRLNFLLEKIQTIQKSMEKMSFKQKNAQMLKNISEFKSNNILLQKINCLEGQQIEYKMAIKKLMNELLQKNNNLKSLTIAFESLKEQLREVKEEPEKSKSTGLSKQQIEDIEGLVKRFNAIKLQSYTHY